MLAVLLIALLATLTPPVSCCLSIDRYNFRLSSELAIGTWSPTTTTSSCHCCALCHQQPLCRSIAHDDSSGGCTLFSRVGRLSDVDVLTDSSVSFFFMPGRSGSDEFCRQNSDCQVDGEVCRAKICTEDHTVTCRDIHRMNPNLPSGFYWISLDGQDNYGQCRMGDGVDSGFTILLVGWSGKSWNEDQLMFFYKQASTRDDFSLLRYADVIRDSGVGKFYQVIVEAKNPGGSYTRIVFNVTRDYSLTGSTPQEAPWTSHGKPVSLSDDQPVVFPFKSQNKWDWYTINGHDDITKNLMGAIVRRDKHQHYFVKDFPHPEVIRVLIRE